MPLLFHISKLRPDMHLAETVMNGSNIILPKDWQLTAGDIVFLKNNSPSEYIAVAMPAIDKTVQFEDNQQDKAISLEVSKNIEVTFRELSNTIRSGAELNEEAILNARHVIAKMLTRIQYNPVTIAFLSHTTNDADYLANHTANVFYLSLLIGKKLANYVKEERKRLSSVNVSNPTSLSPLATGAFYHDIGLVPTGPLRGNNSSLSKADTAKLNAHPAKGCELVAGKTGPMTRQIVLGHHENWDGSGFPKGSLGDRINVYARIVRVADAYCTATSPHANKNSESSVAVLYKMTHTKERTFYDPIVVQALMNVIQPFPNGAILKLQTGESAVVVGHNPQDSVRPKVVIMFDKQHKSIPNRDMEAAFFLGERDDLEVVGFGKEDVSFLNNIAPERECEASVT